MVRCVDCANFNPKTRQCQWSGAFLTEQSSKKSMPCDGFQRKESLEYSFMDVKECLKA